LKSGCAPFQIEAGVEGRAAALAVAAAFGGKRHQICGHPQEDGADITIAAQLVGPKGSDHRIRHRPGLAFARFQQRTGVTFDGGEQVSTGVGHGQHS
jgi:hypothetical protein